MLNLVRTVGQEIVRGEEPLKRCVPGEGVRVQGEDVDPAGDPAPDQLARGVVTQVQLRGQHEEVNWQQTRVAPNYSNYSTIRIVRTK